MADEIKIWRGTKDKFEALANKNPNDIYFVKNPADSNGQIYKGNILYSGGDGGSYNPTNLILNYKNQKIDESITSQLPIGGSIIGGTDNTIINSINIYASTIKGRRNYIQHALFQSGDVLGAENGIYGFELKNEKDETIGTDLCSIGASLVGGNGNKIGRRLSDEIHVTYEYSHTFLEQSLVFGGGNNILGGLTSCAVFGEGNSFLIDSDYSLVCGLHNTIKDAHTSIVGGLQNTISDWSGESILGGQNFLIGECNELYNSINTILTGHNNTISASQESIIYGVGNSSTETLWQCILGGGSNKIKKGHSSIINGSSLDVEQITKSLVTGGGSVDSISGSLITAYATSESIDRSVVMGNKVECNKITDSYLNTSISRFLGSKAEIDILGSIVSSYESYIVESDTNITDSLFVGQSIIGGNFKNCIYVGKTDKIGYNPITTRNAKIGCTSLESSLIISEKSEINCIQGNSNIIVASKFNFVDDFHSEEKDKKISIEEASNNIINLKDSNIEGKISLSGNLILGEENKLGNNNRSSSQSFNRNIITGLNQNLSGPGYIGDSFIQGQNNILSISSTEGLMLSGKGNSILAIEINNMVVKGDNNSISYSDLNDVFIFGQYNNTISDYTYLFGEHLISGYLSNHQFIIGEYNDPNPNLSFVIGNGTTDKRNNLFAIDRNGILYKNSEVIQADWNETDKTLNSFIKNKPEVLDKLSESSDGKLLFNGEEIEGDTSTLTEAIEAEIDNTTEAIPNFANGIKIGPAFIKYNEETKAIEVIYEEEIKGTILLDNNGNTVLYDDNGKNIAVTY